MVRPFPDIYVGATRGAYKHPIKFLRYSRRKHQENSGIRENLSQSSGKLSSLEPTFPFLLSTHQQPTPLIDLNFFYVKLFTKLS